MRAALANALRRYADRSALICEDGTVWDYARLEAEARAIAAKIPASSFAVIEGDNSPAMIAAYLGVLLGGGLAHLAEPGRAEALRPAFGPLLRLRCRDETVTLDADEGASAGRIHPDLALLFSTSGTTGAGKMVMVTEENIRSNTEAIVSYLGLRQDDRAITSLKPTYTYGLSVINSLFFCGGALLLTNRSVHDPAFWTFARAQGATVLSGVPHTYEMLVEDDNPERTPSLRLLTQAGGKLRPELVRRFAARGRKAGWRFFVMYGQTEASPRMAYLPPDLAETAPDAIGIAIPGGELSIADEAGHPVETPGVEGELIYRGPNVMAGYATVRADLATVRPPGRLATGDLARQRPDGLFVVTGRQSRFIKPLGRRIGLDDVEQMLARRGVAAAALSHGEGLLVVTETKVPLSAPALAEELGMPPAMVSTRRIFALPRLPSGKIDYGTLQSSATERVWLPAALPRFVREVAAETWRLLVGGGRASDFVHIFSEVLRRPVTAADSFVSLDADSLSYVELSVALGDAAGPLPDGWTHMSVGELERRLRSEP